MYVKKGFEDVHFACVRTDQRLVCAMVGD